MFDVIVGVVVKVYVICFEEKKSRMLIKMTVDHNSYHSLIKMTAKRTMKAQKYQVMPNKRSAATYSL